MTKLIATVTIEFETDENCADAYSDLARNIESGLPNLKNVKAWVQDIGSKEEENQSYKRDISRALFRNFLIRYFGKYGVADRFEDIEDANVRQIASHYHGLYDEAKEHFLTNSVPKM